MLPLGAVLHPLERRVLGRLSASSRVLGLTKIADYLDGESLWRRDRLVEDWKQRRSWLKNLRELELDCPEISFEEYGRRVLGRVIHVPDRLSLKCPRSEFIAQWRYAFDMLLAACSRRRWRRGMAFYFVKVACRHFWIGWFVLFLGRWPESERRRLVW